MLIQVFIQNEAGSNVKHYHDENTLEFKYSKLVSRAYPLSAASFVRPRRRSCSVCYFYLYTPPRPREEIEADIRCIEQDILRMLAEVTDGAASGARTDANS